MDAQRQATSLALAELIYDASIAPERWQDFLAELSEACGGAAATVTLVIGTPGSPSYAYRHGLDVMRADTVYRHLREGLPWTSPHELRFADEFRFANDYIPDAEIAGTAFYREYMQPQGLAPEGPIVFTISAEGTRLRSAIAIFRREGCRPLGAADLDLCNSLVPHLRRAFEIHERLHGEREQRRALAEVIDRFPIGVMLTDSEGRCVSVSTSARRILDLQDGMRMDESVPTIEDSRQNKRLRAAIAAAGTETAEGPGGEIHVIAVERSSGGPPLTVAVTPLLVTPGANSGRDPVAAVFLADPDSDMASLPVLEDLYGLTPAESALVGQLVTGRAVDEIADSRGIRMTTARGYLKNAYRKTGTRSQSELVRLVLTGISPMGSSASKR